MEAQLVFWICFPFQFRSSCSCSPFVVLRRATIRKHLDALRRQAREVTASARCSFRPPKVSTLPAATPSTPRMISGGLVCYQRASESPGVCTVRRGRVQQGGEVGGGAARVPVQGGQGARRVRDAARRRAQATQGGRAGGVELIPSSLNPQNRVYARVGWS